MIGGLAARLPDFPWDSLDAARARAAAHPGGIVDLSVGTPVDPTPELARRALAEAADAAREWAAQSDRRAVVIAGSVVLAGEAIMLAEQEDWKAGWRA